MLIATAYLLSSLALQLPLTDGARPNPLEREAGWRAPFASELGAETTLQIDAPDPLELPGSYSDCELEFDIAGNGTSLSVSHAGVALGGALPTTTTNEFQRARLVLGEEYWQLWFGSKRTEGRRSFAAGSAGTLALIPSGPIRVRNVITRHRGDVPGRKVQLFDGSTLDGWKPLGDARYTPEADGILGVVEGGGQSFLVTERSYGDFILEVDVRAELPGNSGIQIRSHIAPSGRLSGYQVEIDPSDRAWSGGLYDEARRGWLQNLAENPDGRSAFQVGEWNRYRIVCLGPWIRVWVDGVSTVDALDPLDLEGVFGLQVHSGDNTRVRWGQLALRDLGTRHWEPFNGEMQGWHSEGGRWTPSDDSPWLLGDRAYSTWRFHCSGPARLVVFGDQSEFTFDLESTDPKEPESTEQDWFALMSLGQRLAIHRDGKLLLDRVVAGSEWKVVANAQTELSQVARIGAAR